MSLAATLRERSPRAYVAAIVGAIGSWPEAERVAWRELLEHHPEQAIVVGEFALVLGAYPLDRFTLGRVLPDDARGRFPRVA